VVLVQQVPAGHQEVLVKQDLLEVLDHLAQQGLPVLLVRLVLLELQV